MPWIYIGTSELKSAYVGTTPVKEIYVGTTKVRPSIINFATQWPAPDWFHVPLQSEWQAIYDAYTVLWLRWSTNFSTYLKLPMVGVRTYNTLAFNYRGSGGYYWSSTPYDVYRGNNLYFNNSSVYTQGNGYRTNGLPIRCFKNSPTKPTSSWTKLYWTSIEAWGIFWSSTDWLISISSNGSTWYTLMDKNLWATTVYNYWNTLTEANCGKIYQWGNNYWFSWDPYYNTSLISQSSTQVNVTGYWPWNYYKSSTWITTNPRQNSANNWNDLWWWVTWNVPV